MHVWVSGRLVGVNGVLGVDCGASSVDIIVSVEGFADFILSGGCVK
jgi:hypothetical protein